MADNVLGSISIVITGDSSQLNAALNSAVQGAQVAGVKISASMQQAAAGTDQLTVAMGMLAGTIERESAAASLAFQRNLAMQQALNGAARSADNLGEAGTRGGLGLRYIIFGLKDIAEGRNTYALAELVNVLVRLGPAALVAGGALAAIGGTIYIFTGLQTKIRDAKDEAAQAYGELRRSQQLANDELDVSIAKLENEIRVLEHKPVNRASEALSELRVEADKASDSLQSTLTKLNELISKNGIGAFKGFFTFQEPTTKIADLQKNFQREVRGIEKARKEALDAATGAKDADAINRKFDDQLAHKRTDYESSADVATMSHSGRDTTVLKEAAEGFTSSLEAEAEKTEKRRKELADQQKKQALEDAKKGIEEARALAVARLEAQMKALDNEQALAKKNSEAQIALAHGTVQVQIAAMEDRRDAAIATAEEELRVAKAQQAAITADQAANSAKRVALLKAEGAAESQGRTGTEAATIGVRTGEKIASLQAKEGEASLSAQIKVSEAEARIQVERATVAREDAADVEKDLLATLEELKTQADARRRVELEIKEIREKGSGQEAEIKATKDKLAAEREYSLEASHSKQDEIDYLVKIANIEERARQAKISGVRNELGTATAAAGNSNLPQSERLEQAKKAAQLQVQLSDLQAQAENAKYASATQVLKKMQQQNDALQAQITILDALNHWSEITIGTVEHQFAQALVEMPKQIGDSLASAIFNAPKHGQSKGAEIGHALVQTTAKAGENLAGKLITDAIEKLIAQLIGQAAIATLQGSVTAANTAALVALTAAITGEAAATAAGGAGGLLGGLGKLLKPLLGIFGFERGGDPNPDKPFIAGENGAEIINPKGHTLSVYPANVTSSMLSQPSGLDSSAMAAASSGGTSNSQSMGDMHFIINEAKNPRETARHIATLIKSQTRQFSPFNS